MTEQADKTARRLPAVSKRRAFRLAALVCLYALPLFHVVSDQTMPAAVIVFSLILAAMLIGLSVRDLSSFVLPNVLTYPLIGLGLGSAWWFAPHDLVWRMVAAAAGFVSVAMINYLYRWRTGRDGIGLGDAKLFSGAGAWLGLQGLPSVMLWACATGLTAALARHLAGHKLSRTGRLPFGPFLAFGTWLVWLYGPVA